MNSSAYEKLFRSLGFTTILRGKKLRHPIDPPTVYFNRKRNGDVFFTVYRKDANLFPIALWREIPPQQKKDDDRALMTLLPLDGRESDAFRSLALDPASRRDLEDSAEEKRIEQRTDIGPTERQKLVMARRGQGVYRNNLTLIEAHCRVTGVTNKTHLRASHIKPWCKSNDAEKLDGFNGLLLAPHIDHLFDNGFMSFEDDGTLLVWPKLDRAVLKAWAVPAATNVGVFRREQRKYLAYHRENVFKGDED